MVSKQDELIKPLLLKRLEVRSVNEVLPRQRRERFVYLFIFDM